MAGRAGELPDQGGQGAKGRPLAQLPVGLRIAQAVALGDQLPPVDPFDESGACGEQKVAHQIVGLRRLVDRDALAGGGVRPFA